MPEGDSPPDICIEIALWDRFPGWGPEQTRRLTMLELRILFAVLEQQRVTKDSMENLGKPSQEKLDILIAAQEEQRRISNGNAKKQALQGGRG